MTVATAGAEPVALLRADGFVREIASHGVTLGIQTGEIYENVTVLAELGDTILMTTDGLTEARRGRDFLGYDGVLAIATNHRDTTTLTEMGNAIVADARAFGGRFADDVCLVLVRCLKPA